MCNNSAAVLFSEPTNSWQCPPKIVVPCKMMTGKTWLFPFCLEKFVNLGISYCSAEFSTIMTKRNNSVLDYFLRKLVIALIWYWGALEEKKARKKEFSKQRYKKMFVFSKLALMPRPPRYVNFLKSILDFLFIYQ